MAQKSWIVAIAPPNPNGDLHLGHLSGPYLGADVLSRFLRGRGDEVAHVGYVDEHSIYVPRRAGELGRQAPDLAYDYGNRIASTLHAAGMHPGFLGRPRRDTWHDEVVQDGFLRLLDAGAVVEIEGMVYHCPVDGIPLYEAEIRGRCHHCGAPSDGFYCEECALPQESGKLVEPFCTRCGAIPVLVRERRLAIALEPFRDRLEQYWDTLSTRPRLEGYLRALLDRGPLPVTPITRVGAWGIGVPLPGWDGHYLDTWFSGMFGYMAATEGLLRVRGQGRGLAMWQEPETGLVEFIGIDCSFSHAVLWGAVAIALGSTVLPTAVVTNEFYTLEGSKFSTSRGHAIWGSDFLRTEPVDDVRFHLSLTGPEVSKTDFRMDDFRRTQRDVLRGGVDLVVAALADDLRIGAAGEDDAPLLEAVSRLRSDVATSLEPTAFSPSAGAAAISRLVTTDRELVLDAVGRASAGGRRAAALILADVVAPFMPALSVRLSSADVRAEKAVAGSSAR